MFKIYDHTFDWVHILIIIACVCVKIFVMARFIWYF